MKNIYETLTLKELFLFYGYPHPTNEQYFEILKKLEESHLDVFEELETMQLYRFTYLHTELKEVLIKRHLWRQHLKYLKKEL